MEFASTSFTRCFTRPGGRNEQKTENSDSRDAGCVWRDCLKQTRTQARLQEAQVGLAFVIKLSSNCKILGVNQAISPMKIGMAARTGVEPVYQP